MNIWPHIMQLRGLHLALHVRRLFVIPVIPSSRYSPGSRLPGRNRMGLNRVEARIYHEDHNGDLECTDYYQEMQKNIEGGELVL